MLPSDHGAIDATLEAGSSIEHEFELIERLFSTVSALIQSAHRGHHRPRVGRPIRPFLNILWQIGLYVVDGRTIVEQVAEPVHDVRPAPAGATILKSYTAMTGQCDVTLLSDVQ